MPNNHCEVVIYITLQCSLTWFPKIQIYIIHQSLLSDPGKCVWHGKRQRHKTRNNTFIYCFPCTCTRWWAENDDDDEDAGWNSLLEFNIALAPTVRNINAIWYAAWYPVSVSSHPQTTHTIVSNTHTKAHFQLWLWNDGNDGAHHVTIARRRTPLCVGYNFHSFASTMSILLYNS